MGFFLSSADRKIYETSILSFTRTKTFALRVELVANYFSASDMADVESDPTFSTAQYATGFANRFAHAKSASSPADIPT